MEASSTRLYTLLASLRKTSATGKHFFVYKELKRSITRELVFDALSNAVPLYRRSETVETVLEMGLRLFCSLAWIQQEDYITQFLEHNTLDNRLPITHEAEVNRIAPSLDSRFYREVQWEFFPWSFGKVSAHTILPDNVILPFLTEKKIGDGAGGTISMLVIPSSLQDLVESGGESTVKVVRKYIKPKKKSGNTDNAFREERDCLDLHHTLRHSNIIQLLGSYTLNGTHNILFPFLPMDMSAFFAETSRYGAFRQNFTFYAALAGLASAMEAVHNLRIRCRMSPNFVTVFGYHHDIRPANILVTPTTFILTDFGLARSKTCDQSSLDVWNPNRGDYIAPECMNEKMDHQKVGRSYDIWSFGCLVAETATYMERGPPGLEEFREKRKSPRYYEENYINYFFFGDHSLKSGVSDWLTDISRHPTDPVIKSLITMSSNMLQIAITDRPSALITRSRLEFLHIKRLFRDIDEVFGDILAGFPTSQHGIPIHTLLELKIESSKLNSLGVVFGMEDDSSVDCNLFRDSSFLSLVQQNPKRIYDCLLRFRAAVTQDIRTFTPSVVGSGVMTDYIPRRCIDEQLIKDIRQMCEAVPASYQLYMAQLSLKYTLEGIQSETILQQVEEFSKKSPESYNNLEAYTAIKRLELALWQEAETLDVNERELILKPSQVQITGTFSRNHHLGVFTRSSVKTAVLVEWVLFSEFENGQSDEERIGKILIFAGLLHAPKPKNFHVLSCLGFIPPEVNSSQGFGFVYAFPSKTCSEDTQEPTTLRKLFSNDSKYSVTLESKFNIAKCLTSSLYELHCHRWLHKNLSSENIIFFLGSSSTNSKAKNGCMPNITPYLVGFYHSRPDNQIFYSESNDAKHDPASALYQHPDYKHNTNRFQKEYDYYSLGIILLEIAFWEPIDLIRARCDKKRVLDDEGFRRKLIGRYVPRLAEIMGSAYKDAVLACLSSDFNTAQPGLSEENGLERFYWTVVASLAVCHVV